MPKAQSAFIITSLQLITFTCGVIHLKRVNTDDDHPLCPASTNSSSSSEDTRSVCVFVTECAKLRGNHVAFCIDRMFVKSCCLLPNISQQLKDTSASAVSKDQETHAAKTNSQSKVQPQIKHQSATNTTDWFFAGNVSIWEKENDTVADIKNEQYVNTTINVVQEILNGSVVSFNGSIEVDNSSLASVDEENQMQLIHHRLRLGLNLHANTDFQLVCGRSYYKNFAIPKVVGGRDARFAKWPWQLSLRHRKKTAYAHSCGAVLLTNKWIVTAAHCIYRKSKKDLVVRLGEFDQSNDNEILPHIDASVATITAHPHYNERTFDNDIALLRLSKSVTFRANILPVCLPSIDRINDTYTNETAVVTGWGQLSAYGPYPNKLQEVFLSVISNDQCRGMFQRAIRLPWTITQNILCAGTPDGEKDSCEGDSGGPMVVRREDGRWELVGIISWGVDCATPGIPGVYTRVARFVDWIHAVINS